MSKWFDRYNRNKKILSDGHLYRNHDEHDACGVGFVASIDGKPEEKLSKEALMRLKLFGTGEQ